MAKRTDSAALSESESRATRMGQALAASQDAHPGLSGIHALSDPHDAFAARMLLALEAERTLDVQYYIWRNDMTGTLLFEALHKAADRGVRVRLLLDDNNTIGLDPTLAALDSHPDIEVRLFNPFVLRWPRWLGFATDFFRLNHRMHNKSFIADNQAAIIGGRNIGDEYFGATQGILFTDLDVLAVGPIVPEVSSDFDAYWRSESSYPVEQLFKRVKADTLDDVASLANVIEAHPEAAGYMRALRESQLIQAMFQRSLPLEWANTKMISDDPAKALGNLPRERSLTYGLQEILDEPQREVDLVSPYFVPGESGVAGLSALAQRGVQVQVLTNSLEATDVAAVHAGYAKRRKPLLEAGIKLYETRRSASPVSKDKKSSGPFGSSGSSLHAKTFSVDRSRIFVGSFNFDPRSAYLNTELGFVIDSPVLATQIDEAFFVEVPASSYEVRLAEDGSLYWLEMRDGQLVRHTKEPGTRWYKRAWVIFLSWLPIEWLL
jgi:putative cardiolipin synthase